jgi:hypothetical protein
MNSLKLQFAGEPKPAAADKLAAAPLVYRINSYKA